jgi:hypothetical protein
MPQREFLLKDDPIIIYSLSLSRFRSLPLDFLILEISSNNCHNKCGNADSYACAKGDPVA